MIDLSDGTSLWGPSPAALQALASAPLSLTSSYPTPQADELRAALASLATARPEEITTGCGSDDVLDAAFRGLATPGESVAYTEPTFSMIPVFARRCGLQPLAVRPGPGGQPDAEALLATGARILYVCSPCNPTGAVASRATVEHLVAAHEGIVLLDEAYVEFAGESLAALAPRSVNLVVVRTLSKAFALAGLRVGWAVAPARLAARLRLARGPYKVGALAERVAAAAVGPGLAHTLAAAAEAIHVRERLAAELRRHRLQPLPSGANFLLVPVPDAAASAARLRAAGVIVRALPSLPGIGDALRIGVAPWDRLAPLLAALDREVLPCG